MMTDETSRYIDGSTGKPYVPGEEARLRVKHGAYWLDQVYPEWVDKINLQTFDISRGDRCVLGQIAGGELLFDLPEYASPVSGFTVLMVWAHEAGGYEFMEEHGFAGWAQDQNAWVDLIEERRRA